MRFFPLALRARTALVLLLLSGIVLMIALGLGMMALNNVRQNLGDSFTRSRAQFSKLQILAELQPELALAKRFASSEITRRWVENENNRDLQQLFFREAEGYRESFSEHAYFIAPLKSLHFFHNGNDDPYSEAPRYTLAADKAEDQWFFQTIRHNEPYNINVERDRSQHHIKVWFNVPIRDQTGKPLGISGSNLNLGAFLENFVKNTPAGITVMITDRRGLIQAHPDPNQIEYGSVGKEGGARSITRLLEREEDRSALQQAYSELVANPEETRLLHVELNGTPHTLALAYTPEIHWFVACALDPNSYHFLDEGSIAWSVVGTAFVVLALITLAMAGFDRLVLGPLTRLTRSVRQVASGAYDVRLHSARQDELGELTRTFDQMAQNILAHTTHLEERVDERTRELSEAHKKIDAAHRMVTASIDYASLMQRALLPPPAQLEALPGELHALWLPRDTVGGDLYIYRPLPDGASIALMHCAGHGVPGAFMTMIAHAAFDVSLSMVGELSPAALLQRFDATLRSMRPPRQRFSQISSDMDMALCKLDFTQGKIVYSGARIPLRWMDAEGYHEAAAAKRNIGGTRLPSFVDHEVSAQPGRTFYLLSDGCLDQNGGTTGFGFGESAFKGLLQALHPLPRKEQTQRVRQRLDDYRGQLPQRDDITFLAFRLKQSPRSNQQ